MPKTSPSNRRAFLAAHPDVYFIDVENPSSLQTYLSQLGWLNPGETFISTDRVADSNMNCTLRVTTNQRTFILKQSRPWVEKYPHIAAPWDRNLIETRFYEVISTDAILGDQMPRILGSDTVSRTLMLEDLGEAGDFSGIYDNDPLKQSEAITLVNYLSRLHSQFNASTFGTEFTNREMRTLNHFHIFKFPLDVNNDLNLDQFTPGLTVQANKLQQDYAYVDTVAALGNLYLQDGESLLHGDYFPGSWFKASCGIRIIDPEFCFFGCREFDLGVMLAHFVLAEQPETLANKLVDTYGRATINHSLVSQFAGVEIMRRLIGVAQLPLKCDLRKKIEMLDISRQLVLSPQDE